MPAISTYIRAKAFLQKHWRTFVAFLSAGAILFIAVLRTRKPADTPIAGPTGPERANRVDTAERRARDVALGGRALQEAAARQTAELEAAAKLRAEEERLRHEGADASTDISAANAYADKISHRKETP